MQLDDGEAPAKGLASRACSLFDSIFIFHFLQVKISQFITPHRTYECVTVIRCLYQSENNPRVFKKLIELESHCDQRKNSEKYESDRMIVAKFLNQFFKISEDQFSQEDILKICGIIQVLKLTKQCIKIAN